MVRRLSSLVVASAWALCVTVTPVPAAAAEGEGTPASRPASAPAAATRPASVPTTAAASLPTLTAGPAPAAAVPSGPERIDITDALRRGAEDPRVRAAGLAVDAARSRGKEARMARLPHIALTSIVAPLPTRAGDAACTTPSPDCTPDTSFFGSNILGYGVLSATDISVTVPLFTWGKLDAARRIADSLVVVAEGDVDRTRATVYLDVATAYYGVLLLSDLIGVIEEGRDRLSAARKRVDESLAAGSSDYSPVDRLKLDSYSAELDGRYHQALGARATALAALAMLVGADAGVGVEPTEPYLTPTAMELEPLDVYIARAESSRPELTMLEAGIKARRGAVAVERGGLLPDVGLLAYFGYHYSNVAEDQISPFAYDPYNHLRAGVALGVRWSLDVGPRLARMSRARAELEKLEAEGRAIRAAIRLEVEKNFRDVEALLERVRATSEGLKSARKWVRAAAASFAIGTGESRDLLDALVAEGTLSLSNLQAIFELNVAVVSLANASGADAVEVLGHL